MYVLNSSTKSEISLKFSLHRAFLKLIQLIDLEFKMSKAVLNISINFMVPPQSENSINFRLFLQNCY